MPAFHDAASKAEWKRKCAETRARNKLKKGTLVKVEDRDTMRKGNGQGAIAAALDEIDAKVAALQSVRRSLVQAQELVNL